MDGSDGGAQGAPGVALIAALDQRGLIGAANRLPWRLPADLRRFRALTLGKPVIMGRRTHESIGVALPGRDNLVLSRAPGYRAPGCRVLASLEEALAACAGAPEAMVIGGAAVYAAALECAARLYLTRVHASFEGDTYFPPFDPAGWRELERERHPADERNPYPFTFIDLERVRPAAPSEGA